MLKTIKIKYSLFIFTMLYCILFFPTLVDASNDYYRYPKTKVVIDKGSISDKIDGILVDNKVFVSFEEYIAVFRYQVLPMVVTNKNSDLSPSIIINGRLYIPIRQINQFLNLKTVWTGNEVIVFANEIPDLHLKYLGLLPKDGKSVDAYFRDRELSYPMAYALITSSEVRRFRATGDVDALKRATRCGNYLLENYYIDNGVVGWGLPFAWDAFNDQSVNKVGTVYAITTAICLNGFLDLVDAYNFDKSAAKVGFDGTIQETYLNKAMQVADSFIERCIYNDYNENGVSLWYSSNPDDAYDVINVNSMMAGALQRLACYKIDDERKKLYTQFSDCIVSYLLSKKIDDGKAWMWNYYGDIKPVLINNRLNDSVHAAYTAAGLLTYKRYNGRLSDRISEVKLEAGLRQFIVDGRLTEYANHKEKIARTWGSGYLLHIYSEFFADHYGSELVFSTLIEDLKERLKKDELELKYSRQVSHALLGLSSYLYAANGFIHSAGNRKEEIIGVHYASNPKSISLAHDAKKTYHDQGRNHIPFMQTYDSFGSYLNYDMTQHWRSSNKIYLDKDGVPKVKYGDDFYYNPVTVAQFALSQYGRYILGDSSARDKFLTATDRLISLQDESGAFRYPFSWKYYISGEVYKPGWVSGMAQGQALSVLARAYYITGNNKYLNAGEKALHFLVTPVLHGGVMDTLKDLHPHLKDYIIFEEYLAKPASYTLNGFMFALLGLYDWSSLNMVSELSAHIAKEYFDEGIKTLNLILPYYDIGGFTAYDLGYITYGNEPHIGVGYHAVHIYLLNSLYTITGDKELDYFSKLWTAYVM